MPACPTWASAEAPSSWKLISGSASISANMAGKLLSQKLNSSEAKGLVVRAIRFAAFLPPLNLGSNPKSLHLRSVGWSRSGARLPATQPASMPRLWLGLAIALQVHLQAARRCHWERHRWRRRRHLLRRWARGKRVPDVRPWRLGLCRHHLLQGRHLGIQTLGTTTGLHLTRSFATRTGLVAWVFATPSCRHKSIADVLGTSFQATPSAASRGCVPNMAWQ